MCMFANGWLFHTVSHWQLPFSFGQVRKKTSFQFPVFTKHPTEQSTPIFGGGRGVLIAYRSLAWDWSPAPGPALPLTLGSGSDTGSEAPETPRANVTRHIHYDGGLLWRPDLIIRHKIDSSHCLQSVMQALSLSFIHRRQRTIFILCPS